MYIPLRTLEAMTWRYRWKMLFLASANVGFSFFVATAVGEVLGHHEEHRIANGLLLIFFSASCLASGIWMGVTTVRRWWDLAFASLSIIVTPLLFLFLGSLFKVGGDAGIGFAIGLILLPFYAGPIIFLGILGGWRLAFVNRQE